jgi:nitrite reductase/ring-hydroxylating ferredoxin subunit
MKKLYYVVVVAVLSCLSCGKNSDPVPDVAVSFQGSLLSPQLSPLRGYGVAVTIPGGVAGIVIYHRSDGLYVAYDRCSTYQPEKKCAVTIDSDELTVTDPCSGSKFSLWDGTPVKAPATVALKSYYVTMIDQYDISITN